MKITDACNLLGLTGDITPELTKAAYRRASMKFHPDRNPAGLEMMKAINSAYDTLREYEGSNATVDAYPEAMNDAITAVVHLEGVVIEVCGNWVWLSGDTRTHKDDIKAAGFKWATKKQMWFFRPDDYKSASRINMAMSDIRVNHGSQIVSNKTRAALHA